MSSVQSAIELDLDQTVNQLKSQGLEPGLGCYAGMTLSSITATALFVIAIMGAAGAFPGASVSTMGWTTIGLGAGILVGQLIVGNLNKRKSDLFLYTVYAITLAALGALGITGNLSGVQIGWGALGAVGAVGLLNCCCKLPDTIKQKQAANEHSRQMLAALL